MLRERIARTEPGRLGHLAAYYLALPCGAPIAAQSVIGDRRGLIPAWTHEIKEKSYRPRRPPRYRRQFWQRSGMERREVRGRE